jgi:hypothetical protein
VDEVRNIIPIKGIKSRTNERRNCCIQSTEIVMTKFGKKLIATAKEGVALARGKVMPLKTSALTAGR